VEEKKRRKKDGQCPIVNLTWGKKHRGINGKRPLWNKEEGEDLRADAPAKRKKTKKVDMAARTLYYPWPSVERRKKEEGEKSSTGEENLHVKR